VGFVTPIMSTMGATRQKYWGQNDVNTASTLFLSVHYCPPNEIFVGSLPLAVVQHLMKQNTTVIEMK